jgi:ABC-type dipeptide/oligopeptide/nickel transport system ATPase subunit
MLISCLGGGQKQRLARARAVYARKSLVMLDDVFSGLDVRIDPAYLPYSYPLEQCFVPSSFSRNKNYC